MLNAVWHMLKNRVEYQDLGADHFARRDRSKAILRLVRRLNYLGCKVELTAQAACMTGKPHALKLGAS